MAKSSVSPASPTVLSVFTEFLNKLAADKTCDEATVANLKNALDEQALDPQSLRDALFKGQPGQKP